MKFSILCVFMNFQKNRSQKLSVLKKTKAVLESTSNSAQNYTKRFSIFLFYFFIFFIFLFSVSKNMLFDI